MTALDIDALVAIDVHTHAEVSEATGCGALSPEFTEAADRYFATTHAARPPAREMADYYRERKMMAVVFTVDATTAMGVPPVPNDEIAQAAAEQPGRADRVRLGRPAPGSGRSTRYTDWSTSTTSRVSSSIPSVQAFFPERHRVVPGVRGDRRTRPDRPVPHRPDRNRREPARRRRHQAQVLQPDATSTTSLPTSRASRSSWPTRRSLGRTRRCRSPPTSRTSTSTCPDGHPNTSRTTSCDTRTRSCRTRCCSAPTSR